MMWPSFPHVASLTAGLLSTVQNTFNIGRPSVELNITRLEPYIPYMEFARVAYCDAKIVDGWNCGAACRTLPGFTTNFTGGDGDGTQYFYVGYWPTESAVVVAHQGTNPHRMLSVLRDLDFHTMPLDRGLFPDAPSDIRVHSGFAIEHKKTATQILTEVQRLMDAYSSTNVVLIGHSLGGAIAELDTLFMTLNLPEGTNIRGVTFGTPRVGNEAWATFFDNQVSSFTRINHRRDPVPVVPGWRLGFRHVATEIHIRPDGKAVICPGPDDRVDAQCSDRLVPDVLTGSPDDHTGPYYPGIYIGTQHCDP